MDYVVGSVAALISGNVTPNRPKLIRRALTPTKHQPSPNVTPKSEFVEDRSIFLSPTQQKKKAIVKKSPKRIFQNPDLDVTEDPEGNSSLSSPKAEKVKKHLKEQLEADNMVTKKLADDNSLNKSSDEVLPKKSKALDNSHNDETSPSKKKKKRNSTAKIVNETDGNTNMEQTETPSVTESNTRNKKKLMQRRKSIAEISNMHTEEVVTNNSPKKDKKTKSYENKDIEESEMPTINNDNEEKKSKKQKKKKNKKKQPAESKVNEINTGATTDNKENDDQDSSQIEKQNSNKKKKNRKNKSKQTKTSIAETETKEAKKMDIEEKEEESESETEEVKSKNIPNPNAITEQDSDSEHESDNEIESENEQSNEKVLTNKKAEQESSDEEEKEQEKNKKKEKKSEEKGEVMTEGEIKRTLFVGNVPFSNKCKKEVKKIFSKYGQIETIRIRTIPVKDARVTPKLAVIKNELHPERSTVNVYVKYADASSVNKALSANNTVLNGCHLRVTRSDTTGAEHDPRCAVFLGNLPFGIEDDTLRSKFENCGEITSVRVIRDKKTNAGKGFGYVNFASKDGVELALAMSDEDLTIKNRIIRVKRCTQAQSQGKKPGGKVDSGGKFNSGGKFDSGRFGGGGKWGNQTGQQEGAARRVMHKRKQQESAGDGPPNKKQKNINQPNKEKTNFNKEKKPRKEFVGMTAEKKKKHKFDKGLKKKKALSEILTKKA